MDQQIWNVWELKHPSQAKGICSAELLWSWTAKKGLWELLRANWKDFLQVILFSTSPSGQVVSAPVTLSHRNLTVIPLLCKNVLDDGVLGPPFAGGKLPAGFVSAWQMSTTGRRVFQVIPVKEEAFAGVVFCPNLERMAFHGDLPWVPLTSTQLTWLVSMTSSSTGISAYFLGRCPAGHTQLMFALGSCDCSQPCAHSEHESVAKSINPMGLRPIFHWIWALKPVELNLVSANTTFWIGIKLQFYNMIFKPKT